MTCDRAEGDRVPLPHQSYSVSLILYAELDQQRPISLGHPKDVDVSYEIALHNALSYHELHLSGIHSWQQGLDPSPTVGCANPLAHRSDLDEANSKRSPTAPGP